MPISSPIRRRLVRLTPLLVVGPLLAVWFIGGGMLGRVRGHSGDADVLSCVAVQLPFVHELPAKGELESANNAEVRCEVRSRNGAWVRILDVIDEGTYVQPGDFLIRLDSSQLEIERNIMEMTVARHRAIAVKAELAYADACKSQMQYLDGEYALARKTLDRELQVAQNQCVRSREYLDASRRLFATGYITDQQLEADKFSLKTAENQLRFATTRLRILERITKVSRMADLDSAVAVTKVQLNSANYALKRHEDDLAYIDDQIAKCVIRAPVAGEVVLAHLHHPGHSHMIAPGELTRENRVMIRLPDPSTMQVRVRLPEAEVAMVRPGMSATMVLDAFPDVELRGEVVKVNEYPEMAEWFDPSIKEYLALVHVETPIAGMRPGLTAAVKLLVDERPSAIQVATQAVIERLDGDYCVVYDGRDYEVRPVKVGPNNGQTVVIESGLAEGDRVLLRPAAYLEELLAEETHAGDQASR